MGIITILFSGFFGLDHINEWIQVQEFAKSVQADTGISFYKITMLIWSGLFAGLFIVCLLSLVTKNKLGVILSFGITLFAIVFMFILSPVGK